MHPLHKLWLQVCAYGLVRNSIMSTTIPMKKDELYMRRVGLVLFATAGTPVFLPGMILNDLENIERKFRGMKTEVTVPFIS
jgi:hypothetical protein